MQSVAVVGPGAVGSIVAAWLAQKRRSRGHGLRTVAARDLRIETPDGPLAAEPWVLTDPSSALTVDWVLVATKAYDVAVHRAVARAARRHDHAGRGPPERRRAPRAFCRPRAGRRRSCRRSSTSPPIAPARAASRSIATARSSCPPAPTATRSSRSSRTRGSRSRPIPISAPARGRSSASTPQARCRADAAGDRPGVVAAARLDRPGAGRGMCRGGPRRGRGDPAGGHRPRGRECEPDARPKAAATRWRPTGSTAGRWSSTRATASIVRLGRKHGIPTPINSLFVTLLGASGSPWVKR